ncbi:hypothetical protein HYG81_12780 [Natrinema zhouii]|uniref:Uncharacterized protein n=1 Tax=Natrinema zhouii TaxID=1710539 RepID=A0A7D6GJ43_9EURY|nr:hypothetical protein [Natrinema zhouii]QLK24979.1 hypothetical protein HYG81_12780 [Natrinema zhouii]
MTRGLEPTEEYDGSVTVRLLDDRTGREEIRCTSYEDAIAVIKETHRSVTVAKLVDRNGAVVFTSAEMDIDDWETEWEHAKRRMSVDVEAYDCPHDSVGCFADDLCVQCQIDRVQERY